MIDQSEVLPVIPPNNAFCNEADATLVSEAVDCTQIAVTLGLHLGQAMVGAWAEAPAGCFAHEDSNPGSDRLLYFNTIGGTNVTTVEKYDSICTQNWKCSCHQDYYCTGGCEFPHVSHTCTLKTSGPTGSPTPSPSYVPTATPSAVPTLQPSKAPTPPPSPTAAPTAMPTFPIVETDEFTTKCPHIHCETDLDGFITVHHHLGDDSKGSRVKHVCGHELHAIGKCGCECYTETDGEDEATLKDLMGPNAFTVLQHVRVTRKAHKERPGDIAYPRGYASPLLADGTRAHISTGHMDGLDEDHTAWEKEGQFHLVDRTHFSMTDMDADPVILQGGHSRKCFHKWRVGKWKCWRDSPWFWRYSWRSRR